MKYLLALLLSVSLLTGCGTPQSTTFKATGITIAAVNFAEDTWGDYVRAGLATDAQQAQVRKAVGIYNEAITVEKVAVEVAFASGNTANLTTALAASTDARAALFNLIASLLPADKAALLKGK